MNEDYNSAPSANSPSSNEVPSQSIHRRYGRAVLLAFIPCFLCFPLWVFLSHLAGPQFIGILLLLLSGVSVVIASEVRYVEGASRASGVSLGFLTGLALWFGAAVLWVFIFLVLIKLGVVPAPFIPGV